MTQWVPFTTCGKWQLTGKSRHRVGLFGKVILEVQERRRVGTCLEFSIDWTDEEISWRDAKAPDLRRAELGQVVRSTLIRDIVRNGPLHAPGLSPKFDGPA